jgi:serine/threonine protein kinase/Tfp pilus assembly protein PilF
MDTERLRRIEELFHHTLGMEKDQRATYLLEACSDDPSLCSEVESLLAKQGAGWMPERVGSYRILRQIGEGAMGVVYEAEQDQPRRTVALKVIKPGMTTREVLRRFELESQALARLQHPGAAQIYEAGTADIGFGPQPFFAMELIRGRTLLEYAEEHRLSARQRLELMVRICAGVDHAHQRGLIHRDLKPGNILVEETGQPKIVDFGVARATDNDMATTRATSAGQLIGTLAYMSPEQVLADPLELDARSDVYALGVILHELLTGRLPYELDHLPPHAAARTILEQDPTRLSSIDRGYRGDIETIVAKALEKDKARRYTSAASLAADIERYLRNEPITARPPTASYQLGKFARRNKALVAGGSAVVLTLLVGIVVSAFEARRARQAEQITVAVNDFLQKDLLAQASASEQARPDSKPDPDLKVRTALDRASARIEGKFKEQPLVEASIRQTISKAYEDLGLFPEAQRHTQRVLELRRRSLGEDDPATLDAMDDLMSLETQQGKYESAEPLAVTVLEKRRRILGEEHTDTLEAMDNLGLLYWNEGKYPQAESLLGHVVQVDQRVLGNESPRTLEAMGDLALVYNYRGNNAEAEPLAARVLELKRRVLGEEHPRTLIAMSNLALIYSDEGKYEQAETLDKKLVEVKRRLLGEQHLSTLTSMNNLASVYVEEGKYEEAAPLRITVVDIERQVLGEEHPSTLASMSNLAVLYGRQGKYELAEPLLLKALEVRRRKLGEEHPDTLHDMGNLGAFYVEQSKFAQAEPLLSKAIESCRRVLGREHSETLANITRQARLYQGQGKYEKAESLYMEVLESGRHALGAQDPRNAGVLVRLASIRTQQQRYSDAESLLRDALATYDKKAPDTWQRYNSRSLLGASLTSQGKYAEAEPLVTSGYQGMVALENRIPAASRIELQQAGARIVELYRKWGKAELAIQWNRELNTASPAKSR